MRVTYSRELALKAFLDEEKIENFIPMRRDYIVKKGRRIRRPVSYTHPDVYKRQVNKSVMRRYSRFMSYFYRKRNILFLQRKEGFRTTMYI